MGQNYFAQILHLVAKLFKLELNKNNPQINIKLGKFYQIADVDSDLVQKWLDKLVKAEANESNHLLPELAKLNK